MNRSQLREAAAERAVRLALVAASPRAAIDPLFRRRLRGRVMNTYVDAREGVARPASSRRGMGTIGRACLYASVAVALSVGSVMAASRASVPGDLLYPVKRQLEEMRQAVLPAEFYDEMAAYAFAERVHELGRLIEAGELSRATALLPDVRSSFDALVAARPAGGADSMLARQLSVLAGLLERLPEPATNALERALERAPGLTIANPPGGGNPHGQPATVQPDRENRAGPDRGRPDEPGTRGNGGDADHPEKSPSPQTRGPDGSGRPDASPAEKPDPSDGAEPQDESD